MKKRGISLIITSFFVLSNIGVAVQAAGTESTNDTTEVKSAAGVTPDSILYKVDEIFDNLKVALAFSNTSKAEALIKVSDERLAESKIMKEKNKTELADKTLLVSTRMLDDASLAIEKEVQKDKTDNKKDGDKDTLTKSEKTLALLEKQYGKFNEEIFDKTDDIHQAVMAMQIKKKLAVATMVDELHNLDKSGSKQDIKEARELILAAKQKAFEEAKLSNFYNKDNSKQTNDTAEKEKQNNRDGDKKEKTNSDNGKSPTSTPAVEKGNSSNAKGNSKKQ